MKSMIFHTPERCAIECQIQEFLNSSADILSAGTAHSARAAGDAIQKLLSENCERLLGHKNCVKYSGRTSKKGMADFSFTDQTDLCYIVNVKTHRIDTKFNMPNLTSVRRLAKLYQEKKNYFVIMMIHYNIVGIKLNIGNVRFVPIEFLDWKCLTIGALGWGQIQIKKSNDITIEDTTTRQSWMLELCDQLSKFYPKETHKIIGERISYFESVKEKWLSQTDE